MKLLVLLLSVALVLASVDAGMQYYRVKGRLMCGSKGDKDAKVKLVDEDTGGPDDTMAETKTGTDGKFQLEGSTSELTSIDPILKIYTNCDDGIKLGRRKWRFELPKKYIDKSGFYDVGTWQTELRITDEEERDMINIFKYFK